jgi:hypothetical protein
MVTNKPTMDSLILDTLRQSMLRDLDVIHGVHRRPPGDFTVSAFTALAQITLGEINAAISLMGNQYTDEISRLVENKQVMVSEELCDDLSAVLILKIKAEYLLQFIADNKLVDVAFERMMAAIPPDQAQGVKVPVRTPEQPAA